MGTHYRLGGFFALALAVFPAAASDADSQPPGSRELTAQLQEFRHWSGEGMSAYKAGDFAQAIADFRTASAFNPAHPEIWIMLARSAARAGLSRAALESLSRYAQFGLVANPHTDPALATLANAPGFGAVEKRLELNAAPIGSPEPVFTAPNSPLLVEKIEFDAKGNILLGTVHQPGVYRVAGAGLETFSPPGALTGIFGMQADPVRGDLWVVTAAAAQVPKPAYAEPELVRLDLATGAVKSRFVLKAAGAHQWGDVAIAGDGTVYASDGLSGEIWRLKPNSAALDLFVGAGAMRSPQGMVVTPGQDRLMVADYSTGFHVFDRGTAADHLFPVPAELSLVGTDGIATDGRTIIYAVQNGVTPQRLIELTLDQGWTRVAKSRVLAANLPVLDQPTSAILRGSYLYFIATSQWSEFDDDGALTAGPRKPALICKLPIPQR
jgi:hypothetical protein